MRYEVIDPNGVVYLNNNPSGSFEWEQFRIATNLAVNPGDSDYQVGGDYLPDGAWAVRVIGLDMSNLNFWATSACAVRPIEGGGSIVADPDGNHLALRDISDFGLEPVCSLLGSYLVGDFVFLDQDNDGIQDPLEPGISGVVLHLRREVGGPVVGTARTGDTADPNWASCLAANPGLTDTAGLYCFGVNTADTYIVEVAPENFNPGGPLADLSSTTGGDTLTFELVDSNVLTFDFGYLAGGASTASLGDRVWLDGDGDGIQGAGEPGIDGVTVELVDDQAAVIATTTTAGDGNYLFEDLVAGTYTVRVLAATLPPGLAQTYDLDGLGSAHAATAALADAEARTDVDFGYRGTGSLGDRLWLDNDGDGVQDGVETGLNGIAVELLDGGGAVIATTTTAGNGLYLFGNLAADSYRVRVVAGTLPGGLVPTFDLDGIGTAHVAVAVLAAGQNRVDVDFGYRGTGSLGDRVWLDSDADGIQDAGEAGINGATIELRNGVNVVLATTTTAGNGTYTFANLPAGGYTVRVNTATLPGGLAPTFDLDGIGTAHVAAAVLAAGQNRVDVDFGYRGTGSLGDRVWLDTDGDRVQDAGRGRDQRRHRRAAHRRRRGARDHHHGRQRPLHLRQPPGGRLQRAGGRGHSAGRAHPDLRPRRHRLGSHHGGRPDGGPEPGGRRLRLPRHRFAG